MKTKVNPNALLSTGSLIFYEVIVLTLFITGKISMYIHPRMYPYLIGSVILVGCLIIAQLSLIPETGHQPLKLAYLLFIIPFLLIILFPASSLQDTITRNRGVAIGNEQTAFTDAPAKPVIQSAGKEQAYNKPGMTDFIFTDDNYMQTLNNLYLNLDAYIGESVTISGFVFKPGGFTGEQFVLARMSITCCAADASVVGLACSSKKGSQFTENLWYEVRGILGKFTYSGEEVPIIEVTDFRKIPEPENIYVY